MKTLLITSCRRFTFPVIILIGVQLVEVNPVKAQAAVCDGTTMYAIFNDSTNATVNTPSKIYPVSFSTGVLGTALTTSGLITIKKKVGGTTYYGSASLGVDPVAHRFYANSQMINPMAKDFFAISTVGAGAQNVIATTPSTSTTSVPTGRSTGLDDYHFVKMTVNQAGTFIYALGVIRDTTLSTPATSNPLVRMAACGTTGCANASMMLLGYLPPTPSLMANWSVYNGDIAFDNVGNLFFATVAFANVNSVGRYTDARLFEIYAADIPTVTGTGTIPMHFIADYNSLDSTAMDGIAFDMSGSMYMTTKRFNGVQGLASTTVSSQMYKTSIAGTATLMPAFAAPAGYAIADLASCNFPLVTLAQNELDLYGRYIAGNSMLNWNVNDNTDVSYYEVQRSDDGINFSTLGRVNPQNSGLADAVYNYNDPQSGYGQPKYYRIREVMNTGMGIYSKVITIIFNTKISVIGHPAPNPFIDHVNVDIQLKTAGNIEARLTDQSGRVVYQRMLSGVEGENKITLDGILHFSAGMYILELSVDGETSREKLVKQR